MLIVPEGKRESMSASPAPDNFALAKGTEEVQVKIEAEDGTRDQVLEIGRAHV